LIAWPAKPWRLHRNHLATYGRRSGRGQQGDELAALVALLVEAGTSSLDNGTGRGEVVHPVGEEDGQKDGNN
jgi:hypothetical protein